MPSSVVLNNLSPNVVVYNNYHPFGMLVPNRHASSTAYRYGFQGQEKDDEIKGEGNSLNYKFRMHDPRVGRFFAVDPLTHKYPFYTPYQFSGNTPVMTVELEGLEPADNPNPNENDDDVWRENKGYGDPDTEVLEPVIVTATSKKSSSYHSDDTSGSLKVWKETHGYTDIPDNKVGSQYHIDHGNSYVPPKPNSLSGVDIEAFRTNWRNGALNWDENSIGNQLQVWIFWGVGGTMLGTVGATSGLYETASVAASKLGLFSFSFEGAGTRMAYEATTDWAANGFDVTKVNIFGVLSSSFASNLGAEFIGAKFSYTLADDKIKSYGLGRTAYNFGLGRLNNTFIPNKNTLGNFTYYTSLLHFGSGTIQTGTKMISNKVTDE